MVKIGQKQRKFSRQQKLTAVKRVLIDGESQMDVERDLLGIKNCTGTLYRWIKAYIQEGEENVWMKEKRGGKKFEKITNENVKYEILKKFNAFLEKELKKNSNSSR